VIRWKQDSETLTVYLCGEIDHYAAETLRKELETLIRKTKQKSLMLDFSEVSFMDSSGVGMLIGRYKTMAACGRQLFAIGLNRTVERLYKMAGLHRIIPIVQEERVAEA